MELEIRNLSMAQKIGLWLALVWVVFCLLGAFGNSWYLVVFVCLALLAAIVCLFKKILDAKYAWTIFAVSLILPFVSIGIMADSEDEESKENVEKTESTKETIKFEKAEESSKEETKKEEKKQEPQLSPKEQDVANAGYKKGTMFGMAGASNEEFSNMMDMMEYVDGMEDKINEMWREEGGRQYDIEYDVPTNAEEEELKNIYIEHFIKGMNETMDAMDNLDKIGGKSR